MESDADPSSFYWPFWALGSFYRDVIEHLRLAGYNFQQYSAYVRDNSTAIHAWGVMVAMAHLAPRGRIQTTAHRLLLYRSPNRFAYDVAPLFQPGAALFEALEGPTPRGRVPDQAWGFFVHAPIVLQVLPELPRGTRDSDAARDPANWVGAVDM
jgi:hypothetical protein